MEKSSKIALGDFQTPSWFAQSICALLHEHGYKPATILEPTCGLGNLLMAALDTFTTVEAGIGVEIRGSHIQTLQNRLLNHPIGSKVVLHHADFFATNWPLLLAQLPPPFLMIGNPPWVTNAQLGMLASDNLPPKRNFKDQTGMAALTGASNFDISEWMLLKLIGCLQGYEGQVAMLCKTAVARRVLQELWQKAQTPGTFQLYQFDSHLVFNVAVDACLLVYTAGEALSLSCPVYQGLSHDKLMAEIGHRDGQLVANAALYDRWCHLRKPSGQPTPYQWRSGVKHDCAQVMELSQEGACYVNKLGEGFELEATYLYPLLKSSDIAKVGQKRPFRWLLIPQRTVGESTLPIKTIAPKTWHYLEEHAPYFARRKSRIYQNQPRFSIFGVGSYTFAPWKVVISGFYKKLDFMVIGPQHHKPVVLDDTCYFLATETEEEALLLAHLLNSEPAREFFAAFIFWDAKRPITASILNKLNIEALAQLLGQTQLLNRSRPPAQSTQLRLFEERSDYS